MNKWIKQFLHGRLQEPTSEPAYKKKRNMAGILLYGRNEKQRMYEG
jgi:hypothetical protein